MIETIYKTVISPALLAAYRQYAKRDQKAKGYFQIREKMFDNLKELKAGTHDGKVVLFHAASVGELLMAMPVMSELKRKNQNIIIAFSYTSVSLFNNMPKNVPADIIVPSPVDIEKDVKRFLDILDPALVVFSTYDLWPCFVFESFKRNIQMILINASLPKNSDRLKIPARYFHKSVYSKLEAIGAITKEDAKRFLQLGVSPQKTEFTGNCRFDQTLTRCESVEDDDPALKNIWKEGNILIAGSTWSQDHDHLLPSIVSILGKHKNFKAIIAPHEPDEKHVSEIESFFNLNNIPTDRFTKLSEISSKRVVIVDTVGVLYKLYKKGHAAFIGGSFKQGVHNVMEPAGFGLPVLVGPEHKNSAEAIEMIESGGALVVQNSNDIEKTLDLFLCDNDKLEQTGNKARDVVVKNSGATKRTVELVRKYL